MQKKLSSESIYKGKIFEMTRDHVEIENGAHVTRDVIHHHGGVAVLAIQDTCILLVSQYRYAASCEMLEIPAGKLELNEDPYTCGLRELEEETGYTAEKLELYAAFYSTPGFCNEKLYVYEAINLEKVEHPLPMDEDECIEVMWIPVEEAYAKIQKQEIVDAKTIIAIQYAYQKLKK